MPIEPCPAIDDDNFQCPTNSGPSGSNPGGPMGLSGSNPGACPVEIWAVITAAYKDGSHDWAQVMPLPGGAWGNGSLYGTYCPDPHAEWPAYEVNGNKVLPGTVVRLKFLTAQKRCENYPRPQCYPVFEYCCEKKFEPLDPPDCPGC